MAVLPLINKIMVRMGRKVNESQNDTRPRTLRLHLTQTLGVSRHLHLIKFSKQTHPAPTASEYSRAKLLYLPTGYPPQFCQPFIKAADFPIVIIPIQIPLKDIPGRLR